MKLRLIHRRLSPWLFILLALSAITGLTYRVGKAWFGMDKEPGKLLMSIHTIAKHILPNFCWITSLTPAEC